MQNRLFIYGAYGYTGELITKLAAEQGLNPILSGRNAAKLQPLAEQYGLESRAVDLNDTSALDAALHDVKVFLHCAGPFIHTYKPVMQACLKHGIHYLDITGEWEVFEAFAAKTAEAQKLGIMFMPGTGFDVVPSDCLAAYLKQQLPDATDLELAFVSKGRPSRGTQKTMIEGLGKGGAIRKNGKITTVKAGYDVKHIDFGDGQPQSAATIPWGDISTAYYSTGIPNIKVYTGLPEKAIKSMKMSNWLAPVLNIGAVKRFMQSKVDSMPPGPSETQRQKGYVQLWGKATNNAGKAVEATMRVPEGYTLTALTAVAIAGKVLAGEFKPGFQTPASMYGADFITQFDGVERK